jgi:hypothetical protein
MANHRIRALIHDKYTRTCARHIKKGDLSNYTTDDKYIYKDITPEEYTNHIINADSGKFKTDELGISWEIDYTDKDEK